MPDAAVEANEPDARDHWLLGQQLDLYQQRTPLRLEISDQKQADGALAVRTCFGERLGTQPSAAIAGLLGRAE